MQKGNGSEFDCRNNTLVILYFTPYLLLSRITSVFSILDLLVWPIRQVRFLTIWALKLGTAVLRSAQPNFFFPRSIAQS